MEDILFFIRLNIQNIIMFAVCLAATAGIAWWVIRYEKKNKRPITLKILIPTSIPMAAFVLMLLSDRYQGMTYPTGIAQLNNIVLVRGTVERTEEDQTTGIEETTYRTTLVLVDKATGKKLTHFYMVPYYIRGNKLLCYDGLQYPIIDLESMKVTEMLSSGTIEEKANVYNEKIYAIAIEKGDNAFSVRTVRDKTYTYDPINNDINPTDSYYPFKSFGPRPEFTDKRFDLFKPELIGTTSKGISLVLSYEDLEKKHYKLSAINAEGQILWEKWEYEISSKLDGERFDTQGAYTNLTADENFIYFVNDNYLVSLSLQNGELQWILSL